MKSLTVALPSWGVLALDGMPDSQEPAGHCAEANSAEAETSPRRKNSCFTVTLRPKITPSQAGTLLIQGCLPGPGARGAGCVAHCFSGAKQTLAGMQQSQNSNPSISHWPTEGKYRQKWGESPVSRGFAGSKLLAGSQKAEYCAQPNTHRNFSTY